MACAGYEGREAESLIVDFSPKGGPTEVVALASYAKTSSATLTFPDGNVWTMVPCTNPNLKTPTQRAYCEQESKKGN